MRRYSQTASLKPLCNAVTLRPKQSNKREGKAMAQWSQQTLEALYQVHLTANDCRIINLELEGIEWELIEEDTRVFKDVQDYTDYVYDTEEARSGFFQLLKYLAMEEVQAQYTAKELLLGDDATELDNGKIFMILW